MDVGHESPGKATFLAQNKMDDAEMASQNNTVAGEISSTNDYQARPNMNGFWRQYTNFCCMQQSPIKCKATSPSIPGFYWGPRVLDTHERYNKR